MKLAFKLMLILLLLAILPQKTMAYDFKEGGLCYNVNEDGKSVTMTYETLILFAFDAPAPSEKGYEGDIVIPRVVIHEGKAYTVTAIDRGAFSCNSNLKRVFIPESVKTLGREAFFQCHSLQEVILPPDLNEIVDYTFAESGLQTLVFPQKIKTIGENAFVSSSLKSVNLPNSVVTIEKLAFSGCRWMKSVTLGNKVKTIGEAAFSICSDLKSITLPASLKEIGPKAFYECSGLESIVIPASVSSIGEGVFSSCHGLTSITVDKNNKQYDSRKNCNAIIETATNKLVAGCNGTKIPKSVTAIGNEAFYGCDSFTAIDIPSSVKTIGNQAFFYCRNLKELNIPNSVESIGERAFCGCDSLEIVVIANSVKSIGYGAFLHDDHIKTVTIGSGITSIGGWAFKGLDAVKSITSKIDDPSSVAMGNDVFDEIDMKSCTLYVPQGTAQLYKTTPQWKEFKNIVEN